MTSDSFAERRLRDIHELRLSIKQRIAASLPGSKPNVELERQLDALDLDSDDAESKRDVELRRRFKTD